MRDVSKKAIKIVHMDSHEAELCFVFVFMHNKCTDITFLFCTVCLFKISL